MADNVDQLFGDYSPQQSRSFTQTPLQGIQKLYPNVKTGKACQDGTPCTKYDSKVVKTVVTGSDLVILALGTGQAVETEGIDRPDIHLPGNQEILVFDTVQISQTVIMLLFNAGPLNVSIFDEMPAVSAIMACFLPAQATGEALVIVLTNKDGMGAPAGRLPMTWPLLESQIPDIANYSMTGRTYRYIERAPLYPFGYGLSYSKFQYEDLQIQFKGGPKDDLKATFTVTNVGSVDSDEVIQCYIEWSNKSLPVPQRQLAYFDRIHVDAGQQQKLSIVISWESWLFWDEGQWAVAPGSMMLLCGGQQPRQKRSAASNIVSEYFIIRYGAKISKF